jgi:predicted RND superfamily exporter protein
MDLIPKKKYWIKRSKKKVEKSGQKMKEKVSEANEQFMRRTENIGERMLISEGSRKLLKEYGIYLAIGVLAVVVITFKFR